jgi:hypothetical protein
MTYGFESLICTAPNECQKLGEIVVSCVMSSWQFWLAIVGVSLVMSILTRPRVRVNVKGVGKQVRIRRTR